MVWEGYLFIYLFRFPGFCLIWLLSFLAFGLCLFGFWLVAFLFLGFLAFWLFYLLAFCFLAFGFLALLCGLCGFGFPHPQHHQ